MAQRKPIGPLAASLLGLAALAFIAIGLPAIVSHLASQPISVAPSMPSTSPQRQFDRTALVADLDTAGLSLGNAALVRIFKRERRLEVWMQGPGQRFVRFRDYAICNYSGQLGPKLAEGDQQAPEGFYRVGFNQLNPHSRHHLAFNLGFPNAHDRALDRTGSALMVHGGCTSVGCYAMGDAQVDEIYAIVEAALLAGQAAVDVHAFPFVLSSNALAEMANHPWARFWANLKQGHDLFEQSRVPPRLGTCNGDYRFGRDVDSEGCVEIGYWRA